MNNASGSSAIILTVSIAAYDMPIGCSELLLLVKFCTAVDLRLRQGVLSTPHVSQIMVKQTWVFGGEKPCVGGKVCVCFILFLSANSHLPACSQQLLKKGHLGITSDNISEGS